MSRLSSVCEFDFTPRKGVILSAAKDLGTSPGKALQLAKAAAALGSNLPSRFGFPADNLREALHRLADLGTVTAVSSFHVTAPVGYTDQPDFVNAAVVLGTDLGPLELLRGLLAIEASMGRDRSAAVPSKGPRVIDLDLLLYNDLILTGPELTLPHPAMHQRRFVLEPLTEIAPDWLHPTLHKPIADLIPSS